VAAPARPLTTRETVPTTLTDRLYALARDAGASRGVPGARAPADVDPVVLADRFDGTVICLGDIVAKAHPPSTETGADADPALDAEELTVRLRVAAHPRLSGILLPPLAPGGTPAATPEDIRPQRLADGRLATLWPRGTAVTPGDDIESVPWEAAGTLLARLHSVPLGALSEALPGRLPAMRGPLKAARAMGRMRAALGQVTDSRPASGAEVSPALAEAADAVERAWSTLPAWCRGEAPPPPSHTGILCHGDFHLGQLVRHPAPDGPWQLIDVDDLGLGDPAWDLARPAAWYAAGLLPADSWNSFLHAYQARARTSAHDPWPRLDAPARALTVQTAALGVAKAHAARRPLDEAEAACADACVRIADSADAPVSADSSVTEPPDEDTP
jgi:hypothetical protein